MKKVIVRSIVIFIIAASAVVFAGSVILFDISCRRTAISGAVALTQVYKKAAEDGGVDEVSRLCVGASDRVSVIAADGTVLFDEMAEAGNMENHANRPEITSALGGSPKASIRKSATVGQTMIYYAETVTMPDGSRAAVRVALHYDGIKNYVIGASVILVVTIAVTVIIAGFVSGVLGRRIVAPIKSVAVQLRSMADGTYTQTPIIPYEEFDAIVGAANELSERLAKSIASETNEKRRLYFVLDSMQEGLIAIDKNNDIVLLNRYMRAMFDVGSGLIGKNVYFLTDNAEITGNFYFAAPDKIYKINHNGRVYVCRIAKLRDESLSIMLMTDITEYEERTEFKQTFFENASHELKTPITSISGFCELLDGASETERHGYISIIERDVGRLLAIIEDMMIISRLENSQTERHTEPCSLAETAAEAAAACEVLAKPRNISINISGEATVSFDKGELYTLLLNLVNNAVKYNKDGGRVDIIIKSESDGVTLSVRDTGIGIEQRHLARIFERFYRVDKGRGRSNGGTGLGLAIVKHLVLANDAEISVKSNIGIGTEFTVKMK